MKRVIMAVVFCCMAVLLLSTVVFGGPTRLRLRNETGQRLTATGTGDPVPIENGEESRIITYLGDVTGSDGRSEQRANKVDVATADGKTTVFTAQGEGDYVAYIGKSGALLVREAVATIGFQNRTGQKLTLNGFDTNTLENGQDGDLKVGPDQGYEISLITADGKKVVLIIKTLLNSGQGTKLVFTVSIDTDKIRAKIVK